MITRREAERLCKSFLGDNAPPKLPENFAFEVRKMAETPYGFGCVNITNQANLSANGGGEGDILVKVNLITCV